MPGDFKIQITGDASHLVAAGQRAGETLDDVGRKTEDAAEHTKEFNFHGREMHRVFGELDRILPGVGESLHAIMSPELAPILGLVVAFELLGKVLNGVKASANAAAESVQALARSNIEAWLKQIDDAIEKQDKLTDSVNATKDAEDALKKSFQSDLDIIKQQAEEQQKLLDAKEKLALAEADGDPVKQAKIRAQFGDLKGQSEQDAKAQALHAEYINKLALESQRQILQTQLQDSVKAQHDAGLLAEQNPYLAAAKERLTKEILDAQNTRARILNPDAGAEAHAKIPGLRDSLAQVEKQYAENEERVKKANEAHERVTAALHVNADAIEGSTERLKGGGLQFVQWKQEKQEIGDVEKITLLLAEILATLRGSSERGLDVSGPTKQLHAILQDPGGGGLDGFINASTGAIHEAVRSLELLNTRLNTSNQGRAFPGG
jgi:hypothetical protein